tara:strand:+ start:678 stop:1067 length:390 start_codon:yes stop_codon:yes gene_type:complete
MSKVGEYYRELQEKWDQEQNNEGGTMNYQTHNETQIDVIGTSLMGSINLNYHDIVKKLGKPSKSDGYKIDAEWNIEFKDGTVATLYNWKNGRNYCGDDGLDTVEIAEWHIGGKSKDALQQVQDLFEEKK